MITFASTTIIEEAERRYPNDFSTRLYVVKEQLKDYISERKCETRL